jgi:hypothetical protein
MKKNVYDTTALAGKWNRNSSYCPSQDRGMIIIIIMSMIWDYDSWQAAINGPTGHPPPHTHTHDMSMDSHGGMMILTGENSQFVHQSFLEILSAVI